MIINSGVLFLDCNLIIFVVLVVILVIVLV